MWECEQCGAPQGAGPALDECGCGGNFREPLPDVIPDALLREAQRCEPIRGRVRPGVARYAVRTRNEIVGFVCPHPRKDGWWRLGPIYVTPAWRGEGLALAAIMRFRFLDLRHYVPDTAPESRRMHVAAGFVVEREMKRGTVFALPRLAE